jgi:hypothetical protein
MTIFDALHYYGVNHAVICSQIWGNSDWFVVCHKSQLKNVQINVSGVYNHNGYDLYTIDMLRKDVLTFYDMYSWGYYIKHKNYVNMTVYELPQNGFREYINKTKMTKRIKIKTWKRL